MIRSRGFAEIELDLRRRFRAGRGREVRFLLETEPAGKEDVRERLDRNVVALNGLVELAALDGDAILRAFELRLQIAEGAGSFQIGIALNHNQQPRQGGGQAALGLVEFGKLGGIGGRGIGIKLDLTD